jgi:DNA polymerase-3 subunit epsilon/CBS domain-containing protein
MPTLLHNTPLFALEAVTLDTETTGLDPRTARIVEIGAMTVSGGRVVENRTFQSFVALAGTIPAAATAIHGLTAEHVAGAPPFPTVFEELKRFIGGRVVIGHTIGFDLALFKRECERAGPAPAEWPVLDVRFLAEIAAPPLADFSVEALAAWLDITPSDRHRALGDALAVARIYLRLVPKLRAVGIKTFGEAARACASLTHVLDHHHRVGWIEPTTDLPDPDRRGLDSYPYRHRVSDVMTSPPVHAAVGESVREALARMVDAQISSLFVGPPGAPASGLGIVTERDILRAVRKRGAAVLDEKIETIAKLPLITVPAGALVYRAIGRMRRFNIRHLAVVGGDGRLAGALSARDLLRLRAEAAIILGDDIDQAADVPALGRAWAKVPAMAAALLKEEVGARDIAGIIARELGALARRAAELAQSRLEDEGEGGAPCAYALLILGSAGRRESLLALDQDHALLFEHGDPDGPEDRWFAELGRHIADILHEVGVPYCDGGVMSSNAAFRGSLRTWRERVSQWIGRARPEDLLNVDIFYDMRPVHGDRGLAAQLWDEAWAAAKGKSGFLKLLAETNVVQGPPFGLFGRLKREDGRIDLKLHGLRPIVANARLLALHHGVRVRSTLERLEGVKALGVGGSRDLEAAIAAHERILGLILRAQLADIASGQPPSNKVPLRLIEQHGATASLKADLRLAAILDDLARDQLT